MVEYRVDGSRRIDAAYEFSVAYLGNRKIIADIGCGIGMFSELVGNHLPKSKVVAVDLSERNIEFAKNTIKAKNVALSAASVIEQFSVVLELAGGPVEAFCMIDVIEHVPEDARAALLKDMIEISSEDAILILTYPSPEYQRHLMATNPEELQIIDNIIEIDTLIGEANEAGWHLREFRYVDIWQTNQYVHAAFSRRLELANNEKPVPFCNRVRNLFDRLFLRPHRVRKFGAKND
jgi:SAM-dependent methyltransferase